VFRHPAQIPHANDQIDSRDTFPSLDLARHACAGDE
jgi:hypothetical protein